MPLAGSTIAAVGGISPLKVSCCRVIRFSATAAERLRIVGSYRIFHFFLVSKTFRFFLLAKMRLFRQPLTQFILLHAGTLLTRWSAMEFLLRSRSAFLSRVLQSRRSVELLKDSLAAKSASPDTSTDSGGASTALRRSWRSAGTASLRNGLILSSLTNPLVGLLTGNCCSIGSVGRCLTPKTDASDIINTDVSYACDYLSQNIVQIAGV